MSLQSRLTELVSAVGADVKNVQTRLTVLDGSGNMVLRGVVVQPGGSRPANLPAGYLVVRLK